ncbi:hypothetical protein DM867_03840 [Halosegnis rubeus]|jgi:hypothetical protein|uniref:DUF7119 domain-containing protein n=1 Tax=Halosegnis rubeus TaxID=2212850 RepID=A0A5N5UCE9_9EURY|nr:hypothetical protein [Halosegnis rubeus]KAB7515219.1 hypothetical protein DMP03_08220 [Halosegnis rubeus]KAB7516273.1 hypothetical protein DM867_03840 [Halosegnis rubeus]KAB7517739.1 hypothetical protein DP108_09280 [Halosegnis rubeus]
MTPDEGPSTETGPASRASPVGEPVIRRNVTDDAARFDPTDAESLAEAADVVRRFAENTAGGTDNVYMLRGAAACAALVRGEGSYKAAAERAGGEATVSFIRKWARVHDLPRSVRRYVALGQIAPTAAKHIARLSGEARFLLAWAVLDHELTVREVRTAASAVNDGATVEAALADVGVELGRIELSLPPDLYRRLRRTAALSDRDPDDVVAEAVSAYFE